MKGAIYSLVVLSAIGLGAQTPPNPLAVPAQPAAPGLPASPANPTLPVTAAAPGFNGQTSAANQPITNGTGSSAFANRFGTNMNVIGLSSALAVLQSDLQQALSFLAAANNGSVVAGTAGVTVPAGGGGFAGTPSVAANLGQNLGVPAGGTLAANAGATAVTPTTPGVAALSTPPTGVTNALGLSTVSGGATGSNGVSEMFVSPGSRLMIILQSDMERMLPELEAINGGAFTLPGGIFPFAGVNSGLGGTNGLALGATNALGITPVNPLTMPRKTTPTIIPQTLTPTGRK